MFSASGTTATAGTGSASRAAAITAAAAAPPAMSDRIQEISPGSRLRFSPPESNVIRLPANAHGRPPARRA
jgi:hypothetical protein